ncbi:cupin domain-containing protein [Streptomyces sp. NPDC014676]|uniref:cupin domain-containing protein n=1 Tax=Streptomyces sp. NPDC014676 TaxID=3364879 RepID=UPI00370231CB
MMVPVTPGPGGVAAAVPTPIMVVTAAKAVTRPIHELPAGDSLFMPHGQAHQLFSGPDASLRGMDAFDGVTLGDAVCAVDACPSGEPVPSAIFFNGRMDFDLGGMQGINRLMPDVMLVDATGKRYPGLLPILTSMRHEVRAGRVGFAGVLARLAEVAAAMIVRAGSNADVTTPQGSWPRCATPAWPAPSRPCTGGRDTTGPWRSRLRNAMCPGLSSRSGSKRPSGCHPCVTPRNCRDPVMSCTRSARAVTYSA